MSLIGPDKNQNLEKNISTPMFTAALVITANMQKQSKCPSINELVKENVV